MIPPINPSPIVFKGYSNQIKKLFKKGELPELEFGFYGGKITDETCSVEHIRCACKGGTSALGNTVIATKKNNSLRGNRPLKDFIDFEAMGRYFQQFVGIKKPGFDGDAYIKSALETISKEL